MTSLLDDPLALALGTATPNSNSTAVVVAPNLGTIAPILGTPDINDDQAQMRERLLQVIRDSDTAIQQMLAISSASQHPRAYEVLEKLLMRKQDAARELFELNRTRAEVEKKKAEINPTEVTQTYIANAIFTGTTAELLDKLSGKDRTVIEHDDMLLDDESSV